MTAGGLTTIGIDVGGTKAAAVLVDPADGTVLDREREPSEGTPTDLVATLAGMGDALRDRCDADVAAVGLGIAGLVDRGGVVRWSPNLPAVVDHPVADDLATAVGLPVTTANDATAATVAEARMGAGRGCDDVAVVTLGTGIGAGFVVDGRLLRGAHGFAGEPGHMVVNADGPLHLTGHQGPWEALASGNALGRVGAALWWRPCRPATRRPPTCSTGGAGRWPAAWPTWSWCWTPVGSCWVAAWSRSVGHCAPVWPTGWPGSHRVPIHDRPSRWYWPNWDRTPVHWGPACWPATCWPAVPDPAGPDGGRLQVGVEQGEGAGPGQGGRLGVVGTERILLVGERVPGSAVDVEGHVTTHGP